jgi:hypothetical protein
MNAQDFQDIANFQQYLSTQGPGSTNPGDELWPEYYLAPMLQSERRFLHFHDEHVKDNEVRAFTCANKIPPALDAGDVANARKMAFTALKLDPKCADSYAGIMMYMRDMIDLDTMICGYREILFATRPFYQEVFDERLARFYGNSLTRPYTRALTTFAMAAHNCARLDLATYTYEELLRLVGRDNTGARSPLVACYLKLIARRKRHPSTTPIRTIAHLKRLLDQRADNGPIFGKDADEPMKRWAKLFLAYESGGKWKDQAKAEYKRSEPTFQLVFGETSLSQLPQDRNAPGMKVRDPFDDARAYGMLVADTFLDWPDFKIALHDLLRGPDDDFGMRALADAPDLAKLGTPFLRDTLRETARDELESGRAALTDDRLVEALKHFVDAKQAMNLVNFTSGRWYLGAEFAIVSNRGTCAAGLGHWGLARMDARWTLLMKPDHIRTYERLPRIAEAHFCPQIMPRIKRLVEEVKADTEKTAEDWLRLSRVGIALMSLAVMIAARTNALTDAYFEQMCEVGIEDMFTPVNAPFEAHPILPWLTNEDMEVVAVGGPDGDVADEEVVD